MDFVRGLIGAGILAVAGAVLILGFGLMSAKRVFRSRFAITLMIFSGAILFTFLGFSVWPLARE